MPGRGVRLIVVCEDDEHWRFAYQAFLRLGYHLRELRPAIAPTGRGAAEQWVRQQHATEVRAHRRKASYQSVGLVLVIDADAGAVKHRHDQLSRALAESGVEPRRADERIVILVPKRHIETWVWRLVGNAANEDDEYKRLVQGADFRPAAHRFVELYHQPQQRPENILPAMATAYDELDRIERDRAHD